MLIWCCIFPKISNLLPSGLIENLFFSPVDPGLYELCNTLRSTFSKNSSRQLLLKLLTEDTINNSNLNEKKSTAPVSKWKYLLHIIKIGRKGHKSTLAYGIGKEFSRKCWLSTIYLIFVEISQEIVNNSKQLKTKIPETFRTGFSID